MGKKNKKAKKYLREQALKKIKQEEAKQQVPQTQSAVAGHIPEDQETVAESKEVRLHIKKILITVGILVLIIIGIYFINIKSDFILKLGDWLSRVFNVQV